MGIPALYCDTMREPINAKWPTGKTVWPKRHPRPAAALPLSGLRRVFSQARTRLSQKVFGNREG
eukprot:2708160-Pyramimonas_sp.AAC.1